MTRQCPERMARWPESGKFTPEPGRPACNPALAVPDDDRPFPEKEGQRSGERP